MIKARSCFIFYFGRNKRSKACSPKNSRRGVTLFEVVMVIAVVGILAGVSSLYIKETVDLWRFMTFRSEVVSQGRIALLRMAREIRQVRDNFSVYAASADRFRFSDVHETVDNKIEYQIADGQLKRILLDTNNVQTADNVLATGVTVLQFEYYDMTGQQITPVLQPTNIYWIKITLTLSAGTQSKTLTVMVHPRNLS